MAPEILHEKGRLATLLGAALLLAAMPLAAAFDGDKLTDPAAGFVVLDENGFIKVTTPSKYYQSNVGTNAFDGNIDTYADPNANSTYLGIELVSCKVITGIRIHGRTNNDSQAKRLSGCTLEGANESDWSDAETLAVVTLPDAWNPQTDWIELGVDAKVANKSFKYLRIRSDNNPSIHAGNPSELEFYGIDPTDDMVLTAQPYMFEVERDDVTNQYAVVSWAFAADVERTVVYRSFGEAGPWTEVADVSGVSSWKDTTLPVGVPCWYRIAPAITDGETRTCGEVSEKSVRYRRRQLIERNWNDMTKVKNGIGFIYQWLNSNHTVWSPSGGTAEQSLAHWFDSNGETYGNLRITAAGIDLGEAYAIDSVKITRRNQTSGQGYTRAQGIYICGSNSSTVQTGANADLVTGSAEIAGPVSTAASQLLWESETSSKTPYRYVFLKNPSVSDWGGMVAELQLFGWPAATLAEYPAGATDLAAEQSGASVALSWTDNGVNSSFTVQRSVDGGEWSAVAENITASSWTDSTVALDGTRYAYRVDSVKGEAVSYSAPAAIVPYARGDGTGLHAEYLWPYVSTNIGESVVAVATNAPFIAAAAAEDFSPIVAGVEGSCTNVFVTWSGTLTAPFSGGYVFYAAADDAVSLWIDGTNVLRRGWASATGAELESSPIALSAGEHDILVKYWQGEGAYGCAISWGGMVEKETIPATQLKPAVRRAIPEPWEGARSFTPDPTKDFPGDLRVNGDGSFDFAFSGEDLYRRPSGYNFMWRTFTGDFTVTAKFEHVGPTVTGPKCGLMVRSDLAAAAPFESLMIRINGYAVTCKRRTTYGGGIAEPSTIDGVGNWSTRGAKTVWMRIKRTGSVFTYSYRTESSAWKVLYEFTDANGNYGETVYLGPMASFIQLGTEEAWTTSIWAPAQYFWRVSDIKAEAPTGFRISVQ